MRLTDKRLTNVLVMLDDIVEQYKKDTTSKKRDWRTYEQRLAQRLKFAFTELKPLVKEAVQTLQVVSGETRGSKPKLTLEQKVLLILLKHIVGKSNRTTAVMVFIFSLLSDVDVSYKTVERLYSDQEVILALHNLHMLTLKKKGVTEADCGGDGTGYTLTIKKHYATEAQKLKEGVKESEKHKKTQFVYSFELMDIKTRMYIGCGTSFKSEQDAFHKASDMAERTGIHFLSLRLDKYYSAQSYVTYCQNKFGNVRMYFIPKSNATIKGPAGWKLMLNNFIQNTPEYLKEYYQRNQSESGFAEDKKRIGWGLGQKREDRIDTANMLTTVWHNFYWLG